MFGIGLPELILIMALALIVVGPDKLPEMARSIAKGVMELKKTVNTLKDDLAKDNPLDEVRPQLEDAANSLKKQLGEPGPDGWTGVAGDYEIVDPHEQAISEQASTEEVVVSDIGEPDNESAFVDAEQDREVADSAAETPIEDGVVIDPHEQAISEQATTEEVVVSGSGDPNEGPAAVDAEQVHEVADSAAETPIEDGGVDEVAPGEVADKHSPPASQRS